MVQLRHGDNDLCPNKEEPESQGSERGKDESKCGRTDHSPWKLCDMSAAWGPAAQQPLYTLPIRPLCAGAAREAGPLEAGPRKLRLTAQLTSKQGRKGCWPGEGAYWMLWVVGRSTLGLGSG